MKKILVPVVCFICMFMCGCSSRFIVTTWKSPNAFGNTGYDRILVAGIINDGNGSLQLEMETYFVNHLKALGYNAVSSVNQYGYRGLARLGHEETYRKLCTEGVDAVLTIALIDKTKEPHYKPNEGIKYPANYFFDRVWNYEKIQAIADSSLYNAGTQQFWECILFDLSTLDPRCTIQTRSFVPLTEQSTRDEFVNQIVQKMVKERVIRKQKR
jgi:hypothetical protein